MITMCKTPRFEAYLNPTKQTLKVAAGEVGLCTFPIEINLADSKITASRENKIEMAEELDFNNEIDFSEFCDDELDEFIIANWDDIIVPREKNETDAEYALRLWNTSDGQASIRSCVEALGGDLTDEELGQPEWDVFELPDGTFVTESDSDENAWESADEIRKELQQVADEERQWEAERRWIHEAE